MKKFIYKHNVSTVATLKHEGKDFDICLHKGDVNELPENHEFVKLMIKQGKLEEVKTVAKETAKQ